MLRAFRRAQDLGRWLGRGRNEPASAAAKDHRNTSIDEPRAKMNVLAKFVLQQITQKSEQTARLLPPRRERIKRSVVSAPRRHDSSTAAELAEMNMTEGYKNPQGHHKHAKPRYCPLRPEHLMKYGPASTRSLPSRLCRVDDFRASL
jgi:hypothetical protein